MIFFNKSLIFTQEVFILCKNVWGDQAPEAEGRKFWYI